MDHKYYLIELYTDMPSNEIEDMKMAGEFIKIQSNEAIRLIDILIENRVEFVVNEVGKCLIDRSYEYWQYEQEVVND